VRQRSSARWGTPETSLESISEDGLMFVAVTPWHAWRAGDLPFHHRHPFDRLLAARALTEGIPLVTADASFSPYGVGVLW
jgi:PIN domain nuclease of toxin-antitoxin system